MNKRSGDARQLQTAFARREPAKAEEPSHFPPAHLLDQCDMHASDPEATQITAITNTETEKTLPSFELSALEPRELDAADVVAGRREPLLSSIPPYTNVRCNETKRRARMELPSTTPPPARAPSTRGRKLEVTRSRPEELLHQAPFPKGTSPSSNASVRGWFETTPLPSETSPSFSVNTPPSVGAPLSHGSLGRWYEALLNEGEQISLVGRFLINTTTHSVEWSPEMYRILGYEEQLAPTAEAILARLHPDDARLFGSATAPAQARLMRFARNQRSAVEVRLTLPSGETRRASIHAQCVTADDSLAPKIVGVVVDTTERCLVEQQLLRQQHAQTLSALVGGIAHEINNPIQGIMNYAHLIATTAEDPTLAEFATEILTETERVAHIVQYVLEFARLEHGTPRPVSIAELIEGSLALTQSVLRKDNVIVESHVASDVPLITGVGQQLQQTLVNLITNSQDALNRRYPKPTAEKVLAIRAARIHKAGRAWAEIEVTDRGVGIPSALQFHVFEPFVTTKQHVEGSGLGLTMCRSVVERHGGTLYIESDGKTYTTVTLVLPEAGSGSPLESLRPSAAPPA